MTIIIKRRTLNHIKNIIALTTILLVALFAVNVVIDAVGSGSPADAAQTVQYRELTVAYGDTLWQIAKDYGPEDCDIRKYVYEVCQINNMQAGDLQAGQTIRIPV